MRFDDLMTEVQAMFNNWLNDKELSDHYCGDEEAMQKDFIECIQATIGSDFVVMTKAELHKAKVDYHTAIEWNLD
jgi:hypothetical protein